MWKTASKKSTKKWASNQHQVDLDIELLQPEIGDQTSGEQLGITEEVIAYTSYFEALPEPDEKHKNCCLQFHGLLVPPRSCLFGMANNMGASRSG